MIDLKRQLELLPARSAERRRLIGDTADLFGVSPQTVYRRLVEHSRPKPMQRVDHGRPRVLPEDDLRSYCEIIAALRLRTRNKKGRCLPTTEALRILEKHGVETADGLVKAPEGALKKSTINRYLKLWGYDPRSLAVEQPVVRFQARNANDCWQFDLSPSDLKDVGEWVQDLHSAEGKDRAGHLVPMLYSAVDDRSGVAYLEYHLVYGEDVGAALRFLFRAMAPKDIPGFPFEGIPNMIYTDNGPIARSRIFQRVLNFLGIELRTHMPRGKGGRRVTARSKGKVERPFRGVKEVHETLYHFHRPASLKEANEWLLNYLVRYNEQKHRSEPHSRIEDWLQHLPSTGLRTMCSWERFCTFAREPERRAVSPEATVSIEGTVYEVAHELAQQEVVVWLGLFDNELYVEFERQKHGPYQPRGGPIPLHRYRAFRKTEAESRAERIEKMASSITVPREALSRDMRSSDALVRQLPAGVSRQTFLDPDPFDELTYRSIFLAKKAIATHLGIPLARLDESKREEIDRLVRRTLVKREIMAEIETLFAPSDGEKSSALESRGDP